MQILVFGAGKFYQRYKKYLAGHEIIGILDNNTALHGTYVDGHMVIPPEQVVLYDYDRIYILSYYMQDMFAQLNKLGIPKEKIFFTFDLLDLVIMPEIKFYQANANRTGKKILCISHELSITGAPNCLLYAVKCMKDKGYSITVASPEDGPMRKFFVDLGVDVIVDERLLFSCGKTIDYLNSCDLLFINTAQIHYLLSYIKYDVPIIWWVHELLRMYQCVMPWRLPKNLKDHLSVYAVSSIARDAFLKKIPDIKPGLLPFGIIDVGVRKIRSSNDNRMIFVIIGSVGKEKGHDILFKALKMLPRVYINNLEVWCIGKDETEMGSQLKQETVEYGLPVIFKGLLDNIDVMHSLDEADVLICSSRGETMSMAVAEAMMKGVPAILPDKIGIADFINDKENGYLFAQDDSNSLSECIKYCMENRKKSIEVGNLARKTYERYFSMEVFNAKLHRIIQEKLH